MDAGVLIQINASTFAGNMGIGIRRKALKLIKNDLVHFVSTDCHSDGRRSPDLSKTPYSSPSDSFTLEAISSPSISAISARRSFPVGLLTSTEKLLPQLLRRTAADRMVRKYLTLTFKIT